MKVLPRSATTTGTVGATLAGTPHTEAEGAQRKTCVVLTGPAGTLKKERAGAHFTPQPPCLTSSGSVAFANDLPAAAFDFGDEHLASADVVGPEVDVYACDLIFELQTFNRR